MLAALLLLPAEQGLRSTSPVSADNHVAILRHKVGNLSLIWQCQNAGKASGFFCLGCCQKACVPAWGDFELKTSNLFETSRHFHFCDCLLSNETGSNAQEAVQVAKLFILPFFVFQVYPVPVSSCVRSGLVKVLSFEYNIYFCFIPSSCAAIPGGQKMPFRLSGRRRLWKKQLA